MGRQKKVVCKICYRIMRSDNLKIHKKMHEKQTEKYEKNESNTNPDSVSSKAVHKPSTLEKEAIIKTIVNDDNEYRGKIELGKIVYESIEEHNINQDSIRNEYKEALELYMKQNYRFDCQNVILRPWQEFLLTFIEKPTDREIIWVKGKNGNEGKSWFQTFIEAKYGWARAVVEQDIKIKKSSICQILRHRPLITTDIFLFNVGKAKTFEDVNYDVLEKIKDGRTIASKFHSIELKFKTPNIVIVFSNDNPDTKQLAADRWRIFAIKENELIDETYTRIFK